jgi:5-formyltetrahydrofolate cyclo-ligase
MHEQIAVALRNYTKINLFSGLRKQSRIAVYRPMKFELPAREIVSASAAFENPVYLYPEIDGEKMWFTDENGTVTEPEIIIVPGLFVDPKGNRLGRGMGYYDRYLAASGLQVSHRLFLGYDFQFIAQVPANERDEQVTPVHPAWES